MAKYYCILFDADNTLLNFDAAEGKALAETLVNYGIEPDAETVQTYRTINEELWRQLEKGQIRREKLLNERFSRFLKAIDAAGDGAEMNRYYLEQLSTHPDLMNAEVLDVLRESLQRVIDHTGPVFGASRKECGNYASLDLKKAQDECARYLEVIRNWTADDLGYPHG